MYDEELGINIPEDIDDELVEEALLGILDGEWGIEDTMLKHCRFLTFARDGVMTYNKGIVIKHPGGQEYQITIVRSR